MGQQQSKDELLYQQVNDGNVEGIKALRRDGAGLEWIDREGKTPLIVACMNPNHNNVAKTLVELGANINAYRPGRHGGTPLHHAAKRGLENTIKLLLSHGANALATNDDCQTPLDVARAKGFSKVVRTIESHICLFSGWLREFTGPAFLEVLAPQLVSKKVWVVVLPCGSRNQTKPFKLELAIYSSLQDAKPRTVIALWKANLEEPNFNLPDPTATIIDNSNIPHGRRRRRRTQKLRQTRIRLAAVTESDREHFRWFCNACKGIPQAMPPAFSDSNHTMPPVFSTSNQASAPPTASAEAEDLELAMAIGASIESAAKESLPVPDMQHVSSQASASTSWENSLDSSKASAGPWTPHGTGLGGTSTEHAQIQRDNVPPVQTPSDAYDSVPSAPPIADDIIEDGPIQYPSIDSSPVNVYTSENPPESKGAKKADDSICVVCWDAPVEGACVPCGHMAGCMSCLSEIRGKKWGCPVCRTNIDQVIKLYAV